VWVAEDAAPDEGYVPVTLGDPPLFVCRMSIASPRGQTDTLSGYVVGEAAAGTCRSAAWERVFIRDVQYELLYVREDAAYSWASREELRPDLTYQRSRLWANNAVPIEPMRYHDGTPGEAWLACAALVAGHWRVGQLALSYAVDGAQCHIAEETGALGVRPGYRALYIPLDQ
jgi:hypothetical protein